MINHIRKKLRILLKNQSTLQPLHPLPEITDRWNYDHCPGQYRTRDPYWLMMTGSGSLADGLLRLVSGYRPSSDKFSRLPDDFISLDTYSIGIAHWWSKYAPKMLNGIHEKLIKHAWGMDRKSFFKELKKFPLDKGKGRLSDHKNLPWLLAGWYEIGRHPHVVFAQVQFWLTECAYPALKICADYDLKDNATLACLARIANSRGSSNAKKWLKRTMKALGRGASESEIRNHLMYDIYDHGERLERIYNMKNFDGVINVDMPLEWTAGLKSDIDFSQIRQNGTVPEWMSKDVFYQMTAAKLHNERYLGKYK